MHFRFDAATFGRDFDRVPFGFAHDLHTLDLFTPEALAGLARAFDDHPHDWFVASGAPEPGTVFYDVTTGQARPSEALDLLDRQPTRVLLKRLETYDPRFRELRDALFAEIVAARGGLRGERVVRLESSILISSAATITPFHFDPEINFFAHIAGEKTYHLYEPTALREEELEAFYVSQIVDIAQVSLSIRDPGTEHVFDLRPGSGMHQPQNAPHWVKTGAGRSVSYTLVFETDATRAIGRVRACNHYLRKLGARPTPPARNRGTDLVKSGAMQVLLPVRGQVGRLKRAIGG